MFKKSELSRLISAAIMLSSSSVYAASPAWECRVSADGATWDCYKDGELVIQPMPQAETVPAASQAATADTISVPDNTTNESVAETSGVPVSQQQQDRQQVEAAIAEEEAAYAASQAAEPSVKAEETAASIPTEQIIEDQPYAAAQLNEPTDTAIETPSKPVIAPNTATSTPDTIAAVSQDSEYCLARPQQVRRASTDELPQETFIEADDAQFDDNKTLAEFTGNVTLDKLDQKIRADHVIYNTTTGETYAEGNFRYRRPDVELDGSIAEMNVNTGAGNVQPGSYRLPANNARGQADRIDLDGNGISTYRNVSYTTCEPGKDDWIFNASELTLNENTGVGEATDMTLEFMDVPFFYFPYATFPIDDRRKSGFLIPSIGSSDTLGVDISTPYYFNLAPNYDATVTPRYMSDRGLQLGGEFRHLSEMSYTELSGEILPEDKDYTDNDPRGGIKLTNQTNFGHGFSGSINYADVSDDTYMKDFGGDLANASTSYLTQQGSLNFSGNGYSVYLQALQYEALENAAEKYQKMPQIHFNGSRYIAESDFIGDLIADYTYFDHRDAETTANIATGGRLDLMPSLAYDWRRSWGFVKPKGTLRYTNYDLSDYAQSSIDRTTATFSLDSGLIFERDASWFGDNAIQTLEPRIFYLYTPEENQDDIPLFDTGNFTFSSASLFRENRFTGSDRVGDANQITLAVSSRFLSANTGRQYLSGTFGTIIYFEDRNVGLNANDPVETQNNSSYVLTLNSTPATHWIADAGLQMNEDFTDIEKGSVRLKYSDAQRHLFSARYELDDSNTNTVNNSEYAKLSAYWPVAYNTRLIGHHYYDIKDNENVETIAGIEYGSSCCWRFRALARDYRVDANQNNTTFYLQLELSGFTQIGNDVDSLLENSIEGFVRESY